MKQTTTIFLVFFSLLIILFISCGDAQSCKPSGKLRGKKPPPGACVNDPDCCRVGKFYETYTCSPPVTKQTKAKMTINNFEKGGDGGAPSECDIKYHSNDTPIVALSTGWYNKGKRCLKFINIHY
ncbi:putative kiwellin [Helianthus annuus]|nr:putative kiwellin [Helianthus annuus]